MGKIIAKRVAFVPDLNEFLSELNRNQIISISEDEKGYTVVYEVKEETESNVKPKLTKVERAFVEAIDAPFWMARNKSENLVLYDDEPDRGETAWIENGDCVIYLNKNLFPFITWESGKYWTRTDLLALEVEE